MIQVKYGCGIVLILNFSVSILRTASLMNSQGVSRARCSGCFSTTTTRNIHTKNLQSLHFCFWTTIRDCNAHANFEGSGREYSLVLQLFINHSIFRRVFFERFSLARVCSSLSRSPLQFLLSLVFSSSLSEGVHT